MSDEPRLVTSNSDHDKTRYRSNVVMDFGHAFELADRICSDPCTYLVNIRAMAGLQAQYLTRPTLDLKLIGRCIVIYFYSKTNQKHQCLKFILFWNNSTCFGRSFRPSSGVHDCTCSNRHMSNRYCGLLANGNEFPLASRQQYVFDICLTLTDTACWRE